MRIYYVTRDSEYEEHWLEDTTFYLNLETATTICEQDNAQDQIEWQKRRDANYQYWTEKTAAYKVARDAGLPTLSTFGNLTTEFREPKSWYPPYKVDFVEVDES